MGPMGRDLERACEDELSLMSQNLHWEVHKPPSVRTEGWIRLWNLPKARSLAGLAVGAGCWLDPYLGLFPHGASWASSGMVAGIQG